MLFRSALRAEWRASRSPSALLAGANALLVQDLSDADLFVTAFVARLTDRHLVGSSAGHPPALVVRTTGDVVTLGSGGPALGVVEDAVYDVQEIELAPGDVLVAYTDGLVETRGPGGSSFDSAGVVAAVRSASALPAAALRNRILEAAAAHRAGAPLQDDVTLVVARVTR